MLPLFYELSDQDRKTIDVLHSVKGWQIDFGKDAELLTLLASAYPKVDLYEEAIGFAAWMSEHEQKKKIKHRARFRNWVKKADEFRRSDRRSSWKGVTHRPAESEGHGDTVEASDDW